MALGKTIRFSPARPLAVSAEDATVWEASANRDELEEAFGRCKGAAEVANIVVTLAAEVNKVGDTYEIVLDPQLSSLVDVHDYPWVLIIESLGSNGPDYEKTASTDAQALDAKLRAGIPEAQPVVRSRSVQKTEHPGIGGGDRKFIQQLPDDLRSLGEAILEAVRTSQDGRLRFYSNVGRFVETPDNWWTIKIQPRAGSLVLTVRGLPDSFGGDDDFGVSSAGDGKSVFVSRRGGGTGTPLELKRDRGSNSRFTVKDLDQLEPAKRVLEWAAENRR